MYTVIALVCSMYGGGCSVLVETQPVTFFSTATECVAVARATELKILAKNPNYAVAVTCINWERSFS